MSDGELSDSQTFVLAVESVNDAPLINSDAIVDAYTLPGPGLNGETYTYQLDVTDIDDNALNYELVSSPIGMDITSNGLITWSPNEGIFTSGLIEVKVSDDEGAYDLQIFSISVTQVDCNGDIEGTASIDDCGVCTGGNTGFIENYLQDCAGVCNGVANLDDCGVCSGGTSDHEANSDQDCDGECFGLANLDDCGVCSGGTSEH